MQRPIAPPKKRSRSKVGKPEACEGCGKPAYHVAHAGCFICKANGWRRYCAACEPSQLLACSECKELACKTCLVPRDTPLSGAGMEEHWCAPCPDTAHEAGNERFCPGCVRVCRMCRRDICDSCFMSRDQQCRMCVISSLDEMQEWDRRRKSGASAQKK